MTDPNTYLVSVDEILPGLWLGNEAVSQDAAFMKSKRIALVVNATNEVSSKFLGSIHYIRVPVNDPGILGYASHTDGLHPDVRIMRDSLPLVLMCIRKFRKAGHSVLIHCHAGAQRSAIIAAAYLIYSGRCSTPEQAYKKIVGKRSVAFFGGTSVNFRKALE
jgi:protein-tyrosine phosphatase